MKRLLFVILSVFIVNAYSQCLNCPSGTTAPGAAASPSVKFHGFTSEVNKYDGVAPTCYTKTANTLNGHLQGINGALCDLQELIDSLETIINTNDSTAMAEIAELQVEIDSIYGSLDSVYSRLDSIVTALGQFYNTSIISSDSSLNISSSVSGEVITFDLGIENDSIKVTTENGISGNGQSYNPIKLGGALTENTTINGDHILNINPREIASSSYDSTSNNPLFNISKQRVYASNGDFTYSACAILANKNSTVRNGTWNLTTLQQSMSAYYFGNSIALNSSTDIRKTGDTSLVGLGDVSNATFLFGGGGSLGGHITSMRNLTLEPIFKAGNTLPYTVYRYVSLALSDLTQANGTPSNYIIPTDRYAIYQEGETDKVQMNTEIFILPNLPVYADDAAAAADTAFPSGGLYKTSGSTTVKCKP